MEGDNERAWDAIVCGAGPAGLATAAMLGQAGLRAIVLERGEAIGAVWRRRYPALRLNSLGWLSDLPGERGRWGWRHYPSRDEWIAYLERYAGRHRLSIGLQTEVGRLDRLPNGWAVGTPDGEFRTRSVIVALGYDREPYLPDWPGRESFAGRLMHAAEFQDPRAFAGMDVLIVGANTSGVELAGLLLEGGAGSIRVAMRTPPNLITRHWHGLPMHAAALALDPLPRGLADWVGWTAQRLTFGDLRRHGLTRPVRGIKSAIAERGMGPAVDSGFVAGLKRGLIELVAPVERFEGREVVLGDGRRVAPDVAIAATGYLRGLEPLVGHLGALDDQGRPLAHAEESLATAPNLHFVGYRAGVLGPLNQMRSDAKRIARAVRVAARRSEAGASARGADARGVRSTVMGIATQ